MMIVLEVLSPLQRAVYLSHVTLRAKLHNFSHPSLPVGFCHFSINS